MVMDTQAAGGDKDAAAAKGIYGDWDSFIKFGVREYYDRGFTSRKGTFIALVIASGPSALALAKDSVLDGTGTKRIAIGAGLALALRVGLKYLIGGPLGLVLTVTAAASLISYLFKNQKDIVKKVSAYRTLIGETRGRYEDLQEGWRAGRYDATERNLMIDGLMKRFLAQCDEA